MTTQVSRLGLIAFAVLASAAVINMVMLQPNTGRGSSGKRAGSAATASGASASASTAGSAPSRTAAQRAASDAKAAKPNSIALATAQAAPLASADKDASRTPARPDIRSDQKPDPQAQSSADMQDVTKVLQRELKARGYETGSADGQPGLMTRAAIMAYEHDAGLPLTGEPSAQLLKQVLLGGAPVPSAAESRLHKEPSAQATQVIRTVQQSLVTLGYVPGKVDGRPGEDTVRAIREFELDQGLPETGRVSGQLVARLARLAGQGRIATGVR